MKLKTIVQCMTIAGLAGHVYAADDDATVSPARKAEKIEITGSSIKRIAKEGALPVQTIKREDIERSGITSAEQLVATLSANGNGIDNMTTNQGADFLGSTMGKAPNNGSASASLRGLGSEHTLVLLNGRRVALHGLNGSSVDLNSIPMAALERVEVLKDGASAIYGTDAIGGVINFILRKNYRGIETTAFADVTEAGGGNIYRGSIVAGAGDQGTDGYNLMASVTFDKQERLRGSERDFHNGFQPERGLAMDTTGTPFANILNSSGTALGSSFKLPGDPQSYNRANPLALEGKCDSVPGMTAYRGDITGFNNFNKGCAYDYGKGWSLMQPVERVNLVSRGTFSLGDGHTAYAEVTASRVKSSVEYTEIQRTFNYPAFIDDGSGNLVRSPYYLDLTGKIPGFDNSKKERVRWRCTVCGLRQQDTTTDAGRFLVGLEGNVSGWDYKLGAATASSKAVTDYSGGNMYFDKLDAALATGLVNPFLKPGEQQTQAAIDAINKARVVGPLYGGKTTVQDIDGTVSRELMDLPAGPLAVALGFSSRKESYNFNRGQEDQDNINGAGSPPSVDKISRRINAVYGELSVPVVQDLEMQLAARSDRYSDFGSTTNPKIALRWQPLKQALIRGSYSTGFRAPDFFSLYGGGLPFAFNSDINDPVLCPTGTENNDGCGIRPEGSTISNPKLKPERSKQWSVGLVLQPTQNFSASVDWWRVDLRDKVGLISGELLVRDYAKYAQYIVRDDDGLIESVNPPYQNVGRSIASGVDVNLSGSWKSSFGRFNASLDGSYLNGYKSRLSDLDPWQEQVGTFGDSVYGYDLHLRWKHSASVTWSQGSWSATLTQNFTSGYQSEKDPFGSGFTPAAAPDRVASYTLYNLSATYTGIKDLTVTAGIKNLFDTDPPFSAHNVDHVAGAGWDARVGDPRGRAYTVRVNYKFK